MSLEIVDPTKYPNWNEYILQNSHAGPFHSSEWARVLKDTYNYRPFYLIQKIGDFPQVIIPMMEIKSFLTGIRGVSLPFTDYFNIGEDNNMNEIVDTFRKIGQERKWGHFQFNFSTENLETKTYYKEYLKHELDLSPDEESLLENMKSNTRGAIRRALKNELIVKEDKTLESLNTFYKLLAQTRKKFGVPPQPWKFFVNIWQHIILNDRGKLFVVSNDKKTIGGLLTLNFGKLVIIKYASIDQEYQKLRPNNILYWEAIKHYKNEGYKTVSLGRSDKDNEGLRKFKLSWGTNESNLKYFKYDFSQNTFINGGLDSVSVVLPYLKRAPDFLLKIIGNIAYKHLG